MTVKNAVKKLSKLGKVEINGMQAWVIYGNREISFCSNGGWGEDRTVVAIRVRGLSDHDDIQSDYCAGSFYDTITSAIKSVRRNATPGSLSGQESPVLSGIGG